MVSCRNACILDKEGGGLMANDFLKACSDMEDAEDAALRWVVFLSNRKDKIFLKNRKKTIEPGQDPN
jgi:hypothetical protein